MSRSAAASASNLSLVRQEPQVADAVVLRDRHHRLADQQQVEAARERPRVALEVRRTAPRSPCSRRCGRCRSRTAGARRRRLPEARRVGLRAGTLRADARRRRPARRALPAAAWIIARSSWELYMIARTPRKIGPKIDSPIAGSRSAVGTSTALAATRAHAVEGVVVAVAEEDEEVERRQPIARRTRPLPGLAGPSLVEPGELVGHRVLRGRTRRAIGARTRAAGARATPETAAPRRR